MISGEVVAVPEKGKTKNKGSPGRSRDASCLQYGATVMRLSIGAPHFPEGYHGGHLPVLLTTWVSKSTWYSYHLQRFDSSFVENQTQETHLFLRLLIKK